MSLFWTNILVKIILELTFRIETITIFSLRSRRLEVADERENGRARGRPIFGSGGNSHFN